MRQCGIALRKRFGKKSTFKEQCRFVGHVFSKACFPRIAESYRGSNFESLGCAGDSAGALLQDRALGGMQSGVLAKVGFWDGVWGTVRGAGDGAGAYSRN